MIQIRFPALEHRTLTRLAGLSKSAGAGGTEWVFVGSVFARFASQTTEKSSAGRAGGIGGSGAEQTSTGRLLLGEKDGEN